MNKKITIHYNNADKKRYNPLICCCQQTSGFLQNTFLIKSISNECRILKYTEKKI